jgi:hypothetical protein
MMYCAKTRKAAHPAAEHHLEHRVRAERYFGWPYNGLPLPKMEDPRSPWSSRRGDAAIACADHALAGRYTHVGVTPARNCPSPN